MEKLITQLRILKEMNLKPNYSALAREYGCDRMLITTLKYIRKHENYLYKKTQ